MLLLNFMLHGFYFLFFYFYYRCGHCKRLAPDWAKLGEQLDEKYGKVVKVDCTGAGKETCAKYQVQGYPTLKFIKYDPDGSLGDKAVINYDKARDLKSLLNFAKLHGSPPYQELKDEQVKEFMNDQEETSFVLFTSSKDTEAFKSFVKACGEFLGNAKFGVSFTKTPKKLVQNADSETLVFTRAKNLISNIEKPTDISQTPSMFAPFIQKHIHGKVAMRTSSNDETISRPLLTVFINADYKTNSSYFLMVRNRLLLISKKYDAIQFAVAEVNDFRGYIYHLGFDSKDIELLYTIDDDKHQRFVPKTTLKFSQVGELQTKVTEFVDDFLQDKLPVFLKSQDVVPNQEKGQVYIMVAKTFESDLNNNTKDHFIKMYAPWCGHCKKLAPLWDEIAEIYKDVQDLVIAKFDATANDIPLDQFQIEGFPTLFYVPKGQLKPIPYEGARTKEAIIKFIESHYTGSSKLDQKDEL